jgi:hypothetical protein
MTTNGCTAQEEPYTLQSEARRIYHQIVHDSRLNTPSDIRDLIDNIHLWERKPSHSIQSHTNAQNLKQVF